MGKGKFLPPLSVLFLWMVIIFTSNSLIQPSDHDLTGLFAALTYSFKVYGLLLGRRGSNFIGFILFLSKNKDSASKARSERN